MPCHGKNLFALIIVVVASLFVGLSRHYHVIEVIGGACDGGALDAGLFGWEGGEGAGVCCVGGGVELDGVVEAACGTDV